MPPTAELITSNEQTDLPELPRAPGTGAGSCTGAGADRVVSSAVSATGAPLRKHLNALTRARIAVEAGVHVRSVDRVLDGGGNAYTQQHVHRAMQRLGIPSPDSAPAVSHV